MVSRRRAQQQPPTPPTTPAAQPPAPGDNAWAAYKVEKWSISRVKNDERNARTHPEEQIQQLRHSLKTFGWTMPVLVREDGTLIAGAGRVEAARREGMIEVPVIVATGWTEEQCRAYALADNRIGLNSGWNKTILDQELTELTELGHDMTALGFTDLADLVSDATPIEVTEVATGPVKDRFWISVRGPLCDQAKALLRLQELMADMKDVEVALGTTADE